MADKDSYQDELLVHLLQQGDEEAFEMLYHRYWEKLLTVAYHRTGSMEIAKELVQDVMRRQFGWLKTLLHGHQESNEESLLNNVWYYRLRLN